ncbi:MAG: carbohydrate ABC transporter permease, partial [Actinomycetes bacterium]
MSSPVQPGQIQEAHVVAPEPAEPVERADASPRRRRRRPGPALTPLGRVGEAVRWVLLLGCSALFLYPFAWLLAASFKPRGQVFDNALIPRTFQP